MWGLKTRGALKSKVNGDKKMWKQTPFPGVRYRINKKRKHGVKFDRYFAIRYQKDGKRKEEGLGYTSEGWTAERAALELAKLKIAHKTGEGHTRLSEKRETVKKTKEKQKRDAMTFATIFNDRYFPEAKGEKHRETYNREKSLFKKWISPVIGKMSLKDIAPFHLEKIKKNMKDAGSAARSIQYALAVIRQLFNWSYKNGLFNGDNPVSKVKKPAVDNRRTRFLTPDEADVLLNKLKAESVETWEMALLSLHCGLRASEIFRLTWGDIDNPEPGTIFARDTKPTRNRVAYMTTDVKEALLDRDIGAKDQLVYPAPGGEVRREISRIYERVVNDLGFNEGVSDRRDRVVFHTLRHTYASWLVQAGESIYTIKDLMGHSTLVMTERYSHLAPENKRQTVKTIEAFSKRKTEIRERAQKNVKTN